MSKGYVSPAGLVYLFGDFFASKSVIGGFSVPCASSKVKHSDLANAMFMATMVSMTKEGLIDIFISERKGFLGRKIEDVYAALKTNTPPKGRSYLERRIYAELKRGGKSSVYNIVRSTLGRNYPDPWKVVVSTVENTLIKQGLLKSIKKFFKTKIEPNCNEILKYRDKASKLKSTLDEWHLKNPELYKKLWRSIDSGFSSRIETQDIEVGDF